MNPLAAKYAALKSGADTTVKLAAQTAGTTAPPSRDISALRARLAGLSNGGVNPPEASAALTDSALDPKPEPEPPLVVEAPKRTRRTKAEMQAATAAATAVVATPAQLSAIATAEQPVAASASPPLTDYTTEQLLAEVFRRVIRA